MYPQHSILTSTIAISGTTGSGVQMPDQYEHLGVIFPGSLTNCTMKLQVSYDEPAVVGSSPTNWVDLYNTLGNLVPNWAANTGARALMFPTDCILAFTFIRPVLSTSQGQGAVAIQFVFTSSGS